MSIQQPQVSACIPKDEREASNFGRGGFFAPEGTPENLAKIQNVAANAYHGFELPDLTDEELRERIRQPHAGYVATGESLEGKTPEEIINSWMPKPEAVQANAEERTRRIGPLVEFASINPPGISAADVRVLSANPHDRESFLKDIDPEAMIVRPEGIGLAIPSHGGSVRDFFKEWTKDLDIAATYPQPKGVNHDATPDMAEGAILDVTHITPVNADAPLEWSVSEIVADTPEIGEGVKEMAQRILNETGLSPAELIANSSVTDSQPEIEVDEELLLSEDFDPDNPEHAAMLEAGLASGKIIDKAAIMEQPALIKHEDIRETVVPIPTDLIREFFTNKGLFYMVNYTESRLKGMAFLTYLTNLNIPADISFSEVIKYEEYSEIMKAYMDQRSVINCSLLHVMAAELLLYAKGLPLARSPYMSPVPDSSYLDRFIGENKEQVDRWLHFIDSTQVFALSAIKLLSEHYTPKERFEVVDDKEYVGSNIAQLYRIPEFIAYYFAIEGAEYKLSYFKQQYEEYMFKNERLAKYFRSPHNFAALMFEHLATGTFKASDIGYGLFGIGVFDPASGIAEYEAPTQ